MSDSNMYCMLVLHVLYWLLVSFSESYVIDTSKH
jgi:hypothetical protein